MASMKFDPDAALVKTEDRVRAEEHLERIKTGLVDAPDLLAKFIRHEEWKLLGYTTLEDCFEKSGLKEAVAKGETNRKVVVDVLRKSGFTVKQIAGKLDISTAQVSRIGSGKTGHEARDRRQLEGGEDKVPAPVTPGVEGNPETDVLGKPEPEPAPVATHPLPEPDKTLTPTATLTPAEVAEKPVVKDFDESAEARLARKLISELLPSRLEAFLLKFPLARKWKERADQNGELRAENEALSKEVAALTTRVDQLKRDLDEDLGRERVEEEVMPGSGY
jgi:cell division protein FtsB